MSNHEIFENRAAVSKETLTNCMDYSCCREECVFALKDKHHEFSLGLTTILELLAIAEKEDFVPKLPPEWWWKIRK